MENREKILEVSSLRKSFGEVEAVKGISFHLYKGEMFGLVGPDGAGKTTTIKMLTGLLAPDEGAITSGGYDLKTNRKKVQSQIGYLSQKFSLYTDLSVEENITFFAEINGVENFRDRMNMLLDFTRLSNFKDRIADKLSGGMKQKLALCCALIHGPTILYLDEPTVGVDPVSRRDFWKILSDLLKTGITILLTTPYLDEAERCSRVALLHKGEIMIMDEPELIKAATGKKILEIFPDQPRTAFKILREHLFNSQLFGDRIDIITPEPDNELSLVTDLISKAGVKLITHRITEPNLENVFIDLVESNYN